MIKGEESSRLLTAIRKQFPTLKPTSGPAMKKYTWQSVLIFLLSGSAASLQAAERLPNLVIIFTDDQGYGDLGSFGATGYSTPNLDRLASEGTRFTNFHVAQPVCSASRTALLTGCYPNRLGMHGALGPNANHGLAKTEVTLAEMLKTKDYATGMAGKWHLGHRKPFLPIHHGFDEYLGLPYSNDMWPSHPEQKPNGSAGYPALPLIEGDQVIDAEVTAVDQTQLTPKYTERAVSFIHKNKDKPFFFYLAHSMPHVPLHVSDKFKGKSKAGLYGDVIQEIDWSVGEVLKAIKQTGNENHTIVLFTTDNGPWLPYGDHAGSAGPLREGKGSVWEGGVRVPFLAKWPGHIPVGKTSNAMLMTIDIFPTIAKIVGADLPQHPIDGRDVWPLISSQPGAKNPHDVYYFYYGTNELQAITSGDGRWKLQMPHKYGSVQGIARGTSGKPVKTIPKAILQPELYDLENDLGETKDVSQDHPQIMKELMDAVERGRVEYGDALQGRKGRGYRPPDQVKTAAK
jgi:arylsulfatase